MPLNANLQMSKCNAVLSTYLALTIKPPSQGPQFFLKTLCWNLSNKNYTINLLISSYLGFISTVSKINNIYEKKRSFYT